MKGVKLMNNFDVSGLLTTYAIQCGKVTKKEKLQELIRDLKKELNSEEIKKFSIVNKD
jgi:hypothetical protein